MLRVALRAAQELKDYRSEVVCFRDLISESRDPTELYSELIHLQKTQDDQMGYLETCFSKYLFIDGPAATQALADELTMFCGQDHVKGLASDPLMEWCLRMIQSSLNYTLQEFTKERYAQSAAQAHQDDLPEDFQSLISTNFSGFEAKSTRHESTMDYGIRRNSNGEFRDRMDVYRDYLRRPSSFHTAQELSSAIITRIPTNSKDPHPLRVVVQKREVVPPPPPKPEPRPIVVDVQKRDAPNERNPEPRPTSPRKEEKVKDATNQLVPYRSRYLEVEEVGSKTSEKPEVEKTEDVGIVNNDPVK
jgi:hypothetical protein